MKKLILFCLYLSIHWAINCFHINIPINQSAAKKNMVFSNGKTYQVLEDELRLKHPNMPETIIIDGYGLGTEEFENKVINPMYASNYFSVRYFILNEDGWLEQKEKSGHFILVPQKITEWSYDTARFFLTHEIGHSEYPNMLPAVNISTEIAFFIVAYYWTKILGSAPYKNILTKYGSKLAAGTILATLVKFYLYELEERRADNFAIKHSDAAMLQGAIEGLKKYKKMSQKEYSRSVLSKLFSFNIGWKLKQPVHPTIDSRISKIKWALKSRFGIDA